MSESEGKRYPAMIDIKVRDLLSARSKRFKGILTEAMSYWDVDYIRMRELRPDAELVQVILDEVNHEKMKDISNRYGLSHRAIVEMAVIDWLEVGPLKESGQ